MQLDKNPFFRKAFVPWYTTDAACLIKAALMLLCLLFGIDGVKVARDMENCHGCVGIPLLLVGLSFIVLMINIIRLIERYIGGK
ncbi:MAG: hypothetical protein Q7U02_10925 [Desulfosalsimonadaceae bacterium]|nr:hypothetical protein [Desulfosalsimonadaceae bacterium]